MLNIVLASDENYVHYLSTCLISILKNNSADFDKINIFILDTNIKEDSKTKIKEFTKEYNCEIIFIPIDSINENYNIPSMEKDGNISFTTYSRLFISSLLPKNIEKILYLDCDSLILGSFKDLWKESIENYSCGAVIDEANGTKITKSIIGLNEENNYYNAGVLLINLKYWRENDIEKKFIDFILKNNENIPFHDQDIINGVLSKSIKKLHPKYNLVSQFHETDYEFMKKWAALTKYYDKKTIEEAQKDPIFLHFTGSGLTRPWINKNLKYRSLYEKYAKLTPFYKEVFKNETNLTKIEQIKLNIGRSTLAKYGIQIIPMNTCIKFNENRRTKLYESLLGRKLE